MFYSGFEVVHLETLKALEGATEILERLAALGIPTAVVSNKSGSYLRREAAHLGWDRYFHRIVGATDAPRDKPAPDPVYMALEGTGIAAGPDVWFVRSEEHTSELQSLMRISYDVFCLQK